MRFVYRLEPRDYQALVEALGLRRRFGQPGAWLWYALSVANLAFVGFWLLFAEPSTRGTVLALLSGAFAVFAFSAPSLYRAHMRRMVRRHPAFGHEVVVDLAEREIVATYGETVDRFDYAAIRLVDERPGHLLLWIAKRQAIILPKRGLADGVTIAAVRDHVEQKRKAMVDENEARLKAPASARTPWVRRAPGDGIVFEKTVIPRLEDHLAVDFHEGKVLRPVTVLGFTALLGLAAGCIYGFPAWREGDGSRLALLLAAGLGAGLAVGYILFLALRWAWVKVLAIGLREQGSIGRPVRLRFDASGIETELSGVFASIPWSTLADIEKDAQRYYFWISVYQAVAIGTAAFADDREREAFEEALARWYGRAPRTPPRMTRERTLPPEAAVPSTTDES